MLHRFCACQKRIHVYIYSITHTCIASVAILHDKMLTFAKRRKQRFFYFYANIRNIFLLLLFLFKIKIKTKQCMYAVLCGTVCNPYSPLQPLNMHRTVWKYAIFIFFFFISLSSEMNMLLL